MNKALIFGSCALLLAAGIWLGLRGTHATWDGVDVAVVERIAAEAGRPAREPLINTDQGDLLLLVFLLAGACAGFTAGYYFRELFPARRKPGGS